MPNNESTRSTTPMSFRLSITDRAAIQAAAQARGLSQTGLIRSALVSAGVPIKATAQQQ